MSREELRLYLQAWMDSRAEVSRLANLPPSPATDAAYARAKADEAADRALYLRLREKFMKERIDPDVPLDEPA